MSGQNWPMLGQCWPSSCSAGRIRATSGWIWPLHGRIRATPIRLWPKRPCEGPSKGPKRLLCKGYPRMTMCYPQAGLLKPSENAVDKKQPLQLQCATKQCFERGGQDETCNLCWTWRLDLVFRNQQASTFYPGIVSDRSSRDPRPPLPWPRARPPHT